jgi:hypothetical protein
MSQDLHTSGEYLKKNPLWHTDESPWKARNILQIMVVPKVKTVLGQK